MRHLLRLSLCLLSVAACAGPSDEISETGQTLDMSSLSLKNIQQTASPHELSQAPSFPTEAHHMLYRCPMHPQVVQDEPGSCPICGMDLEPAQADSDSSSDLQERARVQINATRQQLIGVQTAPVRQGQPQQEVRAVARVVLNEKLIHHEHTKYDGWVEKLYADFTGKYVSKGQPLLAIYSPELVAAQEEYLLALRAADSFADSDFASSRETSQQVLAAAERKLQLFDLTTEQIARLRNSGQVQRQVTLFATGSGYITELEARQGMRVTAGMTLFQLTNQTSVWVLAQVYENDLTGIFVGQTAEISLPFLPGQSFRGQVDYIDPVLNPDTRTLSVRMVLPNPTGELKPEMFAHVRFQRRLSGQKRLLPASALLDNGQQQWVFVAEAEGRFRPVPVKTGLRFGSDYELLEGPEAGTPVVIQAQFLIDSESQLQAALARMTQPPNAAATPPAGHVGH